MGSTRHTIRKPYGDLHWRLLTIGVLALAAAIFAPAHAQDGSWDTSFVQDGRKLFDVSSGRKDTGARMRLLPGGKFLIAGTCEKYVQDAVDREGPVFDWLPLFCLARLLPDGSFDPSFGPGGVGYLSFEPFGSPDPDDSTSPFAASMIDMALLPDGRIVLAGYSPFAFHQANAVAVAVLLADGSALDPSVASGTGAYYQPLPDNFSLSSIAVQPDGKVLFIGSAIGPTTNRDMAVARIKADFSGLDSAFGTNGIATVTFDLGGPTGLNVDAANRVVLQTDGRIVLTGVAVTSSEDDLPDTYAHAAVARLLPDGQRDMSFGPGHDGRMHFTEGDNNGLGPVAIDTQGRIVVAGVTANASVTSTNWLITRLMPDGSFDASFHGGTPYVRPLRSIGTTEAHNNSALSIALEADGGMFFGGIEGRTYVSVNPGGTTETTYLGVLHLLADGTPDPDFGYQGATYGDFGAASGYSSHATDIALGDDGLMVAGWGQQSSSAKPKFGIGKIQYEHIFRNGFELP